MLAHLRSIVALAVSARGVALAAASELVVVQLNTQAGLVSDSNAAIDDGHAATGDDLVGIRLPGVVGVARVGQMRRGGGGVSHSHERNAKMGVRVHGESQPKGAAQLTETLHLPQAAPIVGVAKNDLNG